MRAHDHMSLCTIAGSDPMGGAGLQGDLKTFAAHGAVGTAVVTAVTVQDRRGVHRVVPIEPEVVGEQIAVVREVVGPAAWKTGMLWSGETITVVAEALDGLGSSPLVVDPVLGATAGGALASEAALGAWRTRLFPIATVITPNRLEGARLLGLSHIEEDEAASAAEALLALGCGAVVLKGGHGEGNEAVDVLATHEGVRSFALPRLPADGHGTGCAFAAALAARLGRGAPLEEAVAGAKAYVHRALAAAGAGGPLRHAVPAD